MLIFLKYQKNITNNSFLIFGSKGKFEITSRPEVGKLYLKAKDKNYKEINTLKLKKN